MDSIEIDNATTAVTDNEEAVTSYFCKICDCVFSKTEDIKAHKRRFIMFEKYGSKGQILLSP